MLVKSKLLLMKTTTQISQKKIHQGLQFASISTTSNQPTYPGIFPKLSTNNPATEEQLKVTATVPPQSWPNITQNMMLPAI